MTAVRWGSSGDPWGVARRLGAASDARRRAVERVLHDGVQQHLALLGLKLSILQKRIDSDPAAAAELCEEVRDELQWALTELRAVAHQIYPAILENEGVHAALLHAAARLGVQVEVSHEDGLDVPEEIRTPIYFCCLEALDLIGRHAGSSASAQVRLGREAHFVTFEVGGEGSVFDAGDDDRSGVRHIADRVEALGGDFGTFPGAGAWSFVRGSLPVPGQERR